MAFALQQETAAMLQKQGGRQNHSSASSTQKGSFPPAPPLQEGWDKAQGRSVLSHLCVLPDIHPGVLQLLGAVGADQGVKGSQHLDKDPPTPSGEGLQAKAPPGSPSTGISLPLEPKRFGMLVVNKLLCLFFHYFLFLSSSSQVVT